MQYCKIKPKQFSIISIFLILWEISRFDSSNKEIGMNYFITALNGLFSISPCSVYSGTPSYCHPSNIAPLLLQPLYSGLNEGSVSHFIFKKTHYCFCWSIRDFGKQNTHGNVSKISVSLTCYWHIGSKSSNQSPLAWHREGQKVTLVALIGGFRSDLLITRKTDGDFGNVFVYQQERQ